MRHIILLLLVFFASCTHHHKSNHHHHVDKKEVEIKHPEKIKLSHGGVDYVFESEMEKEEFLEGLVEEKENKKIPTIRKK